jgi:hypothetical protein
LPLDALCEHLKPKACRRCYGLGKYLSRMSVALSHIWLVQAF